MIRATVNLTTSALLIAMATSLKLPLSTTYVSFMVAMGSSLADRAWGRESAVYRIFGVMTVVGGMVRDGAGRLPDRLRRRAGARSTAAPIGLRYRRRCWCGDTLVDSNFLKKGEDVRRPSRSRRIPEHGRRRRSELRDGSQCRTMDAGDNASTTARCWPSSRSTGDKVLRDTVNRESIGPRRADRASANTGLTSPRCTYAAQSSDLDTAQYYVAGGRLPQ